MPHQCVRCEKLYDDGAAELLKGCGCGGKFFFFMKSLPKENTKISLTEEEKKQIESDVFEIIGNEVSDEPIVLDIESIRVSKPGHYEIDLIDLFKGKPLVYKMADGKYIIDIAGSFEKKKK